MLCLGHVMPGVRGTYDRHEYHAEKKLAFEKLAAHIARLGTVSPRLDGRIQVSR